MVTAMVPSSSSVVAAFLLFGFWKAGTPLEMASTPVSAAQPEENVRASRTTMAKPVKAAYCGSASIPYWALWACTSSPSTRIRNSPQPTISRMPTMKQ